MSNPDAISPFKPLGIFQNLADTSITWGACSSIRGSLNALRSFINLHKGLIDKKWCVIIDLDDTLLDGGGEVVGGIGEFTKWLIRSKYVWVVAVTARPNTPGTVFSTKTQIEMIGICIDDLDVIFRDKSQTPCEFKSATRQQFLTSGYSILATVGDKLWDHHNISPLLNEEDVVNRSKDQAWLLTSTSPYNGVIAPPLGLLVSHAKSYM